MATSKKPAAKTRRTTAAKRGAAARKPAKPAVAKMTRAAKTAPVRKAEPTTALGQLAAGGPVTLKEARALAAAAKPATAGKAMAMKAIAAPQVEERVRLAEERKERRDRRQDDIQRRVDEYKATMQVMKLRTARAPAPAGASKAMMAPGKAAAAPKSGFTPLQILAEGDSWFDYPPFFVKGGLVNRLEKRLGVPILNLAKAGDEVRFMLGVEQYQLLRRHLKQGCPAGGPWDAVLFSGGGNDIVGLPMSLWIKDWANGSTPASRLIAKRFDAALELVRAGYEELIAMRDQLSKGTLLVFHAYDFAIPNGKGICGFGPWLKPALDLRNFPDLATGSELVKTMLLRFAAMLTSMQQQHADVCFINAQGTLPPALSAWHNELHPSSEGFDLHAGRFYSELKQRFPNRVA